MDSTELQAMMTDVRYDQTRLQGVVMSLLEDSLDGAARVIDPSMPFPLLIEACVASTAAVIEEDQILSFREYPRMSRTEEDLYYHMSDKEYEGMFDSPAGAWFYIYVAESEIINKAVRVGSTATKKVVIPKHTYITANNTVFTLQYPIEIIVKAHGGIDIVYDGSKPSPLQTLSSNKVEWDSVILNTLTEGQDRVKCLRLRVFMKQMQLTTYTLSPTGAAVLKKTLNFTDNFYYARAFRRLSTGQWSEIKTTHSQQMFDVNDPTLLLKVVGNTLTVQLPYVYYATSLVDREIRVDVYTTKGPMTMDFSGLAPNSFVATWRDLDNDDNGIYTSPMNAMNTISIISTDVVTGGSKAPTFEERRARMLNNSVGDPVIPISDAQMGTALDKLGFGAMNNLDNVTKRTYLATKSMPKDTAGLASTGIDSSVMTLKMQMNDLLTYGTVIDNGERLTITPKTLYIDNDGILQIVSDASRQALEALTPDVKVNALSNFNYLYTPLHYVLDTSNNSFEVRPYYLNAPSIDITSYAASNDSLGLTVSSSDVKAITVDDSGYVLQIKTRSNDTWKALSDDQVHVQLAFTPRGESDLAFINGTLIGTASGERIFEFRLDTNWDIDIDHYLNLTNFSMFENIPRDFSTVLKGSFSLIWSVSNYSVSGMSTTVIDQRMGKYLLPSDAIGVYQESIIIRFGDELSGLWARSRAMVGERKYQTWEVDVPATYPSNVYVIDPVTDLPAIITNPDGTKQLQILHNKGETILDDAGQVVYLHRIGETKYDEYGAPILQSERTIMRWWDMVLFDATYRYATKASDVAYASEVPKVLVDWINDTLGPIRDSGLENTDLYFQPVNTLKTVEALVDSSETVTLYTSQRLTVNLFVTNEVYQNIPLRTAMESATIAAIVASLNSTLITSLGIADAIKTALGSDVVSIELTGLGGIGKDYKAITLLDESARLCIAKGLSYLPDGTLAVVDAISINFRKHSIA